MGGRPGISCFGSRCSAWRSGFLWATWRWTCELVESQKRLYRPVCTRIGAGARPRNYLGEGLHIFAIYIYSKRGPGCGMLTLRDTGRLHCGAIRNVRFRCHSTVDILPSRQSTVAGVSFGCSRRSGDPGQSVVGSKQAILPH